MPMPLLAELDSPSPGGKNCPHEFPNFSVRQDAALYCRRDARCYEPGDTPSLLALEISVSFFADAAEAV
jgi:hypothetical protein